TATIVANAAASLPAEQQGQGVTYVTGGIGQDESAAFKAAMPTFPLVVEVYQHNGGNSEYSASSKMRLENLRSGQVFHATLEGPFALLRVEPGRYDVQIDLGGKVQHKKIEVKEDSSVHATFVFKG